ncbi:hypothetical protein BU24DRAFT_471629 [Aaosphaeria arxii CBS 175.79]|uniref:Succinate dehydrogenase assembly factor 2, mitochondrial n=1 Tax=Aaosphaeria arxii CBS 175.79 TaxID=1450172 RepID=A0A6A5YA23_9PLEO|nr:uncharacterized protein BU24DRAFT_471629 [Aaosphaeria arxii CBS 175.79]KAF2022422.1 hypothetical protein BU24DRAFT_471629 [Aaosphaeria arxii CBS 175.79]
MAASRQLLRSSRALLAVSRPGLPIARSFTIHTARRNDNKNDFEKLNKRANDTTETYREKQKEKPLNPHLTNTTSTIHNAMPSVGKDAAPPELLSAVDKNFTPKDSVPENTERMTGGTQGSQAQDVSDLNKELGVGELEGAKFRVEPLRRTGEDANTMHQSRKRGTLESELLMSTFADANLGTMTKGQLEQYDLFLDENDWDIYYWATQSPDDAPTSHETAEGSSPSAAGGAQATPAAAGQDSDSKLKDQWTRAPAKGEWAQTVGTFKPAYRPVPSRWKDSEILEMLRNHVKSRSAGGANESDSASQTGTGGLGMMPDIRSFDK